MCRFHDGNKIVEFRLKSKMGQFAHKNIQKRGKNKEKKQKNGAKHVMSGSLLGVELKGIASAPVGYLTILRMYPMDF